jgi:uncharacterized protein (TIGR02246 family)
MLKMLPGIRLSSVKTYLMKYFIFILLSLLFRIANAQGYDTSGVNAVIEKLGQALSKPDPKILADLFTEDGEFTNVRDSTIYGRKNIYDHHYKLWVVTGRPSTRTVHILGHRMRFLGPDAAIIEVRWDNIHTPKPDGTTQPNRDGVWVSSLTREKGQWYLATARNLFLHDGTPGHELRR